MLIANAGPSRTKRLNVPHTDTGCVVAPVARYASAPVRADIVLAFFIGSTDLAVLALVDVDAGENGRCRLCELRSCDQLYSRARAVRRCGGQMGPLCTLPTYS
jgi:hypothetical protein